MCTSDPIPIRLVALDGRPDIFVGRTLVVIGRHPRCDVQLDSLQVSRHHCCLIEANGAVLVRDLGSKNGTRINGQRVGSARLGPGDVLSFAHHRFRLEGNPAHQETVADPSTGPKTSRSALLPTLLSSIL
jgi:pSer/pThr/pTyr-binding forkhead associated (FHA) protein